MIWEIWLPVSGLAARQKSRRWIPADSPGAACRKYFRIPESGTGWVELEGVADDGSLDVLYHDQGCRRDMVPLPRIRMRQVH